MHSKIVSTGTMILAVVSTTQAATCPDISGSYRESQSTCYTYSQRKCESLALWVSGNGYEFGYAYFLDGKPHADRGNGDQGDKKLATYTMGFNSKGILSNTIEYLSEPCGSTCSTVIDVEGQPNGDLIQTKTNFDQNGNITYMGSTKLVKLPIGQRCN